MFFDVKAPHISETNTAEILAGDGFLPALVAAISSYSDQYTKDITDASRRINSALFSMTEPDIHEFVQAAVEQKTDFDKASLNGLTYDQSARVYALKLLLASYIQLDEAASKLFDIEGIAGPTRAESIRAMEALHPAIGRIAQTILLEPTSPADSGFFPPQR